MIIEGVTNVPTCTNFKMESLSNSKFLIFEIIFAAFIEYIYLGTLNTEAKSYVKLGYKIQGMPMT